MSDVISTKQASKMLGVTQRTVVNLIERGELEAQRIGREWAVSRKSVEAYQEAKEARK